MAKEIFEGWLARFAKVGKPDDYADFTIAEWHDQNHRPDPIVSLDRGPVRLEALKAELEGSYDFLEYRKGERSETEAPKEIAEYFAKGIELQERFKDSLSEQPKESS
ncbi:MAG TPA: hypothetical protein VG929_12320 [Actinomycetota bacterium]|nr:hypothetical protein [Actinomycetota bacterium]